MSKEPKKVQQNLADVLSRAFENIPEEERSQLADTLEEIVAQRRHWIDVEKERDQLKIENALLKRRLTSVAAILDVLAKDCTEPL